MSAHAIRAHRMNWIIHAAKAGREIVLTKTATEGFLTHTKSSSVIPVRGQGIKSCPPLNAVIYS